MVANRALAPDSKRGVEEWVREDVALGNPEPIELQHLYRAMDVLLEYREMIHKEVFWSVADLLNLEVDLIFFDTTSTCFETDEEDEEGFRRYGHSKDQPAGPAADCLRPGGDEGGHSRQVLDHAGEHLGHEDCGKDEGGSPGLETGPVHFRDGPWDELGREPAHSSKGRRPLHHRGKAP